MQADQIHAAPFLRHGDPNQTLQVVQACSGLRSVISLLLLSAVFGYFTLKSNILRAVLFICGIPAAILVNIIRVLLLVLAFHYLNYDLTKGTTHTLFGMLIFILPHFPPWSQRSTLQLGFGHR